MMMMTRGGRAWQLLTVAVIAVPWLLRDELALRFDAQTSAAAEVQAALHQESERALQATEQRETRDRLRRIEISVARMAKEQSATEADEAKAEVVSASAKGEADELAASAQTFRELLKDVPIQAKPLDKEAQEDRKAVNAWLGIDTTSIARLSQKQMQDLADKVEKTALDVANSDDPSVGDFTEWNSATAALDVAYGELRESAKEAQKTSGIWAEAARWAAWFFSALGALMIGDWSRALRGPDADPDTRGDEKAA